MKKAILLLLILGVHQGLKAQDTTKEFKNTIRFNVTNPMIFGEKSIVFGYERVLSNNKSITVNFGRASFPKFNFINSDSLKSNSTTKEKGYNVSVDYRFYLSKENKYNAPRGVYIGPYYSFNYFERRNNWSVKSTSGGGPQTVESKTSLDVHNIGFELGYQFVFWNRVSLDMILIGPGIAFYNLKASLGTDLSQEDKQKFFENLNQALEDKFPGYTTVINEGEFQNNGTTNTTALGYRYMVMIGFRF